MKNFCHFTILLFILYNVMYGQTTSPTLNPKSEEKETKSKKASPCLLPLSNAPTLRGLKLGMTEEEASKVLGVNIELSVFETEVYVRAEETTIDVGDKIFVARKLKGSNFNGVIQVALRFFENTLHRITIIYSGDYIQWGNIKEFADNLSDKFNLPKDAWSGKSLSCGNFGLEIYIWDKSSSTIVLQNSNVNNKIQELGRQKAEQKMVDEERKQKQIEEDKKKTFKP